MINKLETELYKSAKLTFEDLCFMFPAPELEEEQQDAQIEAAVSVEFRGPLCGKLMLKACGGLFSAIAANMLGEEESPSRGQQQDALGEIANVICGNMLPCLAGPKKIFRISAPQIVEGSSCTEVDGGSLVAKVRMTLDQGRADLILFVQDVAQL